MNNQLVVGASRKAILADVTTHLNATEPYLASLLLLAPEIGEIFTIALADARELLRRDLARLTAYTYRTAEL